MVGEKGRLKSLFAAAGFTRLAKSAIRPIITDALVMKDGRTSHPYGELEDSKVDDGTIAMTTFQKHDSTMLMGRAPAQRWDAPAPRRGPRTRRLPLVVVAVMAGVLCHAGAVGAATTKPATTKTSYEASSE